MKVLTLNCHGWLEESTPEKINLIAEWIVREKPDVIALQEVNQLLISNPADEELLSEYCGKSKIHVDNYVLLLQKKLKQVNCLYFWTWLSTHIGFDRFDEGLAILTREPILNTQEINLRPIAKYQDARRRMVLGVEVEIGGESIWFYSAHCSWWSYREEKLFEEEWQNFSGVQTQNKKFKVLLGDFNNPADIRGQGYDLILQDGWQDSYSLAEKKLGSYTIDKEIAGWIGNMDPQRIDFVFFSEVRKVNEYRVVFDGNKEPLVSDHFGVTVTFE